MQIPLEITFRGIRRRDALDEMISEKAAKLEEVCEHLISCRVTVEMDQKHHRTGNPLSVRIDMRFPPGHELIVKRRAKQEEGHDAVQALLQEAFDAARRQLLSAVERQRGEVKAHPENRMTALVSELFAEEGYGFLRTVDSEREVYFHRNSVLHDDFDRLTVGTGVRYVAEEGEKGLQASTVEIVGRTNHSAG